MNKKQDSKFQRKDLMLPRSVIAKYIAEAKIRKMSVKSLMENVLCERYPSKDVTKCIMCRDKATVWTGHVHRKDEKMGAGFCETHFEERKVNQVDFCTDTGCYGETK